MSGRGLGLHRGTTTALGLALASGGGSGPVYGNIVSAAIDPRGWAINITMTGSLTSPATNFANYSLTPDGTPKMVMTCSHAGFSVVSGQASADVKQRTIYGTLPVRKTPETYTFNGTVFNPDASVLQETDNGNGTITIKIALSETVLATISADGGDTNLKLSLSPNWRGSDSGCSNVPVTNSSAVLSPRPGHRWADVPSRRVTGTTIRASLVAFSYHPYNLRGIAAVKFTMRDTAGTVKTVWATQLTTSTTYGDSTRLYEVDLDVSGGTPFVAGLVRIDAELYPWLGVMRSTDNGTGMTSLTTVATETPSQRPDCVAYDPAGTRYRTGADFICIDPAGTSTAASVTVAADWATAKAGTRAANFGVALNAAYLANRSISGLTRPLDGMVFGFIAGTHNINPGNINFLGIAGTSVETWMTLTGDPDEAAPSTSCILEASGTTIRPRSNYRWRFSNMSVYMGGSTGSMVFVATDPVYTWMDQGSILRGSVGRETSTAGFSSGVTTPTGVFNTWATGSKAWKYGRAWMAYGHWRVALVRGSQTSRQLQAAMSVSNTFIQYLDPFITSGSGDSVLHSSPYPSPGTDLGAAQDFIQYGNDMRSTDGKAYDGAWVTAAVGGTPIRASNLIAFPYVSYNFHINNLIERNSANTNNMWGAVGENQNHESYCNMFEGNTIVGQRNSFMFSKPLVQNTGPTSETLRTNWSDLTAFRNNAYDKTGEEADRETVDSFLTNNNNFNGVATGMGYSPYRIECYAITYGTDCEGNVNFGRLKSGDANNYAQYLGRFSSFTSGVGNANAYKNDVLYTADQSINGPITNGAASGAGQGNYVPATGSQLIGRAMRANTDYTLTGPNLPAPVARTVPFNTGAL